MKIADLKQPYRRMSEYLGDENNSISHSLSNYFFRFYNKMHKGENPEITEEIKKHFPPDFDFSGDEKVLILSLNEIAIRLFGKEFNYLETYEKEQVVTSQENKLEFLTKKQNMSLFDKENQRKIEDENLQKTIYTQLAKEGKFDQLPDTCEFSEPVELEVWDIDEVVTKDILGKFKGRYISYLYYNYQNAQLPTPKIDFSEFKTGDVVEVELSNEEKRIGWFDYADRNQVVIKTLQRKGNQVCNGGSCSGSKMFNLEKIKSITKIK